MLLAFLKVSESQVLANRYQHIWHTTPAFYPAGTIVSCPALACGARLYRLCAAAPFGDVVTNDGVLLTPVNDAIPARKVWDPLACPLCGTSVVHEGQLHTAERGWW